MTRLDDEALIDVVGSAAKVASALKCLQPLSDEAAIEARLRIAHAHVAQNLAIARFLQARGLDMSAPRRGLLRFLLLAEPEPRTQNDIRADLGVTSGAVTSLVDGLAQEGFVRRVTHPLDRRATIVELTPAGRKMATTNVALIPEYIDELFRDFTDDEKYQLNRLLTKLEQNARTAYEG